MHTGVIIACIIGIIIIVFSIMIETSELFTSVDTQQAILPITSAVFAAGAVSLSALANQRMTLDGASALSKKANEKSIQHMEAVMQNSKDIESALAKSDPSSQ